ncbi:hypothetical protein FJ364_04855 [Candidatus Dependentiae bacterium]|nr:hypothetical protein [Candidatus Dependentiae bacterium]
MKTVIENNANKSIKTFLTKLSSDPILSKKIDQESMAYLQLQRMLDQWKAHSRERFTIAKLEDFTQRTSSVSLSMLASSQGMMECYAWQGLSLYKSFYDFALYPLLIWQLKPKTIIELGSGNGASALWMSNLCQSFGLKTKILSLDKKAPDLKVSRVKYIQGDAYYIQKAFPKALLKALPHPWLFIEDVHHNVAEVLNYFDPYFYSGDYLYLEDIFIAEKTNQIQAFLKLTQNHYFIDHYFTDFFGINATCAENAIWVKG